MRTTNATAETRGGPHFARDGWFLSRRTTVVSEWIDYNGHMNMAFYNRVCDLGVDDLFDHLGIGEAYRSRRNFSMYTVEFHARFLREVKENEALIVATQLLDHDAKRLHLFQEVRHATEGWVAATGESLCLHVAMDGPSVTPFPDDIAKALDVLAERQSTLARPEAVGARVGIRRNGRSGVTR